MEKNQRASALIRAGFLTAVGTALFYGSVVLVASFFAPKPTQVTGLARPLGVVGKSGCGCGGAKQ